MTEEQIILCNKGKCVDRNSIDTEIDDLFDKKNIIDQINKEMLKENL